MVFSIYTNVTVHYLENSSPISLLRYLFLLIQSLSNVEYEECRSRGNNSKCLLWTENPDTDPLDLSFLFRAYNPWYTLVVEVLTFSTSISLCRNLPSKVHCENEPILWLLCLCSSEEITEMPPLQEVVLSSLLFWNIGLPRKCKKVHKSIGNMISRRRFSL